MSQSIKITKVDQSSHLGELATGTHLVHATASFTNSTHFAFDQKNFISYDPSWSFDPNTPNNILLNAPVRAVYTIQWYITSNSPYCGYWMQYNYNGNENEQISAANMTDITAPYLNRGLSLYPYDHLEFFGDNKNAITGDCSDGVSGTFVLDIYSGNISPYQ